jgi:uracil-DNA glycosylase
MPELKKLLHSDWLALLDEKIKVNFVAVCQKMDRLYEENPGHIFPPKNQVFAAFNLMPVNDVKVVILGQDPYPTVGYANGFCFSVNPNNKIPKSLKNIFIELQDDIGKEIPLNGDLSKWANQGIFLLNTILTVENGKPESHVKIGWEEFTDAIIQLLSFRNSNLVFLLWGAKAEKKKEWIDQSKHLVLVAPHPSPLSAYRGFFGCRHFSQTNAYLLSNGKPIIRW